MIPIADGRQTYGPTSNYNASGNLIDGYNVMNSPYNINCGTRQELNNTSGHQIPHCSASLTLSNTTQHDLLEYLSQADVVLNIVEQTLHYEENDSKGITASNINSAPITLKSSISTAPLSEHTTNRKFDYQQFHQHHQFTDTYQKSLSSYQSHNKVQVEMHQQNIVSPSLSCYDSASDLDSLASMSLPSPASYQSQKAIQLQRPQQNILSPSLSCYDSASDLDSLASMSLPSPASYQSQKAIQVQMPQQNIPSPSLSCYDSASDLDSLASMSLPSPASYQSQKAIQVQMTQQNIPSPSLSCYDSASELDSLTSVSLPSPSSYQSQKAIQVQMPQQNILSPSLSCYDSASDLDSLTTVSLPSPSSYQSQNAIQVQMPQQNILSPSLSCYDSASDLDSLTSMSIPSPSSYQSQNKVQVEMPQQNILSPSLSCYDSASDLDYLASMSLPSPASYQSQKAIQVQMSQQNILSPSLSLNGSALGLDSPTSMSLPSPEAASSSLDAGSHVNFVSPSTVSVNGVLTNSDSPQEMVKVFEQEFDLSAEVPLEFVNDGHGIKNPLVSQENVTQGSRIEEKTKTALITTQDASSQFDCHTCDKTFALRRQLTRHMQSHSHVKRFLCTFCGKGFNDKFCLKRHIRTHTGIRPYKCSSCNQSFTQRCSLESHCSKVHGVQYQYAYKERRPKMYVCEECGHTASGPEVHYLHLHDKHPYSRELFLFFDKRHFNFNSSDVPGLLLQIHKSRVSNSLLMA